jgi:hypothetical protein
MHASCIKLFSALDLGAAFQSQTLVSTQEPRVCRIYSALSALDTALRSVLGLQTLGFGYGAQLLHSALSTVYVEME